MTQNTDRHVDTVYLKVLEDILKTGTVRSDRTGVGTIGLFGVQSRYDLSESFPLLTTKKLYTRGIIEELLFFLTGRTDNQWLNERNVNIWNDWADEDGDLGPVYGYQWRYFGAEYVKQQDRDAGVEPGGVDQISYLLEQLKNNPYSRRHLVTAWHPGFIDDMALPPCHLMFQFYVTEKDGKPYGLSCQLYQRSCDMFLGVPFNIASYAALTYLIADLVGLKPLEFVHTLGDAHIYLNHFDQVNEQLSRRADLRPQPKLEIVHPVPLDQVDIADPKLFNSYTSENFVISGYDPHPTIKAPIAV